MYIDSKKNDRKKDIGKTDDSFDIGIVKFNVFVCMLLLQMMITFNSQNYYNK